jgi:hypothetical protein
MRHFKTFFENTPEFDIWYLDNSVSKSPVDVADWNLDGASDESVSPEMSKAYREGHLAYWNSITKLQPNALLLANSDDISSKEYSGRLNGAFMEALIGKSWSIYNFHGWKAVLDRYFSFMEHAKSPKMIGFNVWGEQTDYRLMRFGLTTCLLNDGYFSYTDEVQGYASIPWFDEFDIDLGKPVAPPPLEPWLEGLYRRDFEKGLVIVNPTRDAITIELELGYRRLLGTQDPVINDGTSVTEITIGAEDGIILLSENSAPISPTIITVEKIM